MTSIPLMYAQEDCELGGKEGIEVNRRFLYLMAHSECCPQCLSFNILCLEHKTGLNKHVCL